jgi:D-inositol-3-phosphate glycosyltransferase
MKCLYIQQIPTLAERLTSNEGQRTVTGAAVYQWEAFVSLLQYSTYDCLLLPIDVRFSDSDYSEHPLFTRYKDRIRFTTERELPSLATLNVSVIVCLGPQLAAGTRVRAIIGSHLTPVTAVIHSINQCSQPVTVFRNLAAALDHDAIICSSRAGRDALLNFVDLVKQRMRAIGADRFGRRFRTPVIPLGVATDSFAKATAEDMRAALAIGQGVMALYFGRLSHLSKGDLAPLIIAFSQVRSAGCDMWLVLAGDDTHLRCAERLRAVAANIGCGDRIRVIENPTVIQKRALFRSADIFVAPSDSLQETFGISVVEAMAAGLPVIAADWDGYKDTVADAETGYLIPTVLPIFPRRFDVLRGSGEMFSPDLLAATTSVNVSAMRDALQKLGTDASIRRQFGRAGQNRARANYDWRVVIRQYEELWQQLSEIANSVSENSATPIIDLEDYDYRRIFSHYSTCLLTEQTELTLTRLGMTYSEDAKESEKFLNSVNGSNSFNWIELHSILEDLALRGSVVVSELMSRHKRGMDLDGTLALATICRLLKYGLVEISASSFQCV